MRLKVTCSSVYALREFQRSMVHVPDHVHTIRDFVEHASQLLALRPAHELPQLLLDGYLVPHSEDLRTVLRDDEAVDIEPTARLSGCLQDVARYGNIRMSNGSNCGAKHMSRSPKRIRVGLDGCTSARADGICTSLASNSLQADTSTHCVDSQTTPGLCSVFVGGLDWNVDDVALQQYFEKFGTVKSASVVRKTNGRSLGHGFVEFIDEGSASKALAEGTQQTIAGKSSTVKPKIDRPRANRTEKASTESSRLDMEELVVQLPVTALELPVPLSKRGGVADADINEDGKQNIEESSDESNADMDAFPLGINEHDVELQKQMAALGLPVSF